MEAQIDWRLISNSGTDEGVIRPVIGAGGWPVLPGSGIKGLFRRACQDQKKLLRWCGSPAASADPSPGILRFHGAWPADAGWTEGLLDLAHPQQNWQVGFKADQRQNGHSAFGVVSLHRPLLHIGLSSSQPLTQEEWDEVEATLRRALERGLGGRTSAGYGSSGKAQGELIFRCGLEGQGPAAKLLTLQPEFRPTMFRAAIRGMALRLFGGLCDERTTLQVVGQLFGSLSREEGQNIGLLATSYTSSATSLGSYGRGTWAQPVYATSGQLQWRQARPLRAGEDPELLAALLGQLHGLVVSLGGFGRSWRRPDHRIFLPDYGKTPIGCHWQWLEAERLPQGLHVQSSQDLERLLQQARASARRWLSATKHKTGQPAPWREVLAPGRVGIWTRRASDPTDAEVIRWFHHEPERDRQGQADPRDLKKTDLAGRMNHVGRIWNRLLPLTDQTAPSSGASPVGGPSSRPASPMGRPAAPTSRPGAAVQRASGPGSAVQRAPGPGRSAPGARQPQAGGPVSIQAWQGPYLESVVLFPDPRDRNHGPHLAKRLDQGAGADFRPLRFSDS
ncbi:RAMP superfamily CRISPR-associated protein [Vulcanococcus limneticus]|uniref:RAMP superfamily CRISPR-associated protein n=1 Tax=Vulcanococcus limneticus TaxID=2170428 RepID=UPI00398C0287